LGGRGRRGPREGYGTGTVERNIKPRLLSVGTKPRSGLAGRKACPPRGGAVTYANALFAAHDATGSGGFPAMILRREKRKNRGLGGEFSFIRAWKEWLAPYHRHLKRDFRGRASAGGGGGNRGRGGGGGGVFFFFFSFLLFKRGGAGWRRRSVCDFWGRGGG